MSTVLIALLVIMNGTSQANQQETDTNRFSEANARYTELVEKIKETALPEDIEEIRMVYVDTERYDPYAVDQADIEKNMFEGLKNEDWEKCLANATKILDSNYINLDAHYGAMICADGSGDDSKGEFHRKVLIGLLDAIRKTGDGESEDSAFFCTSTSEVWSFIRMQGYRIAGKSLDHIDGRTYDIMKVIDPDADREFEWYFDVTAQLEFLNAQLFPPE